MTPYVGLCILLVLRGKGLNLIKDYNYRPSVTVFLPTFNEERLIKKKLDNLLTQSYPILEILVYDCSTDRTPVIVQEYQRKYPIIKLIRQPDRIGMAKTLNQAIKDASGEIFIKTDCDSLVKSSDAVKDLIANFADQRIGATTGICIHQSGLEKHFRKFMTKIQLAESNLDSTVIAHASSLLAFRRSLMAPVNANSMADDTEEFVLIRRKGYRTIVDPLITSEEEVPSEFKNRRLQKDRRAQGIIKVLLENIDMIFDHNYGKFGSIVLPLEIFILVFSPVVLLIAAATIGYILFMLHPLLTLILICPIALGIIKRSSMLYAIIDTQLSGLIGTVKSLVRREEPLWARVR
jgi:cellulose synthase/poly-beta-1,6-N-acetylglucosamine synthase-like glycosyltransferase